MYLAAQGNLETWKQIVEEFDCTHHYPTLSLSQITKKKKLYSLNKKKSTPEVTKQPFNLNIIFS